MKIAAIASAVLLLATVITGVDDTPAIAQSAEQDCPSIAILAFRGANSISASSGASSDLGQVSVDVNNNSYLKESGDEFTYTDALGNDLYTTSGWEGPTISRLFSQLLPKLKGSNPSVDVIAMGEEQGYGPDDTKIVQPALGQSYKTLMWSKTQKSATKALRYIRNYNATCPTTKFYAVGHSMGALLIHHLWKIAPKSIVGAYLIGDPLQFSYGATSGTTSTGDDGNGMFTKGWLTVPFYSPTINKEAQKFYIGFDSSERRMICHDEDTLCQWEIGDTFLSIANNTEHVNYFNAANEKLPADPNEIVEESTAVSENVLDLASRNAITERKSLAQSSYTVHRQMNFFRDEIVISVEPTLPTQTGDITYVLLEGTLSRGVEVARSYDGILTVSSSSEYIPQRNFTLKAINSKTGQMFAASVAVPVYDPIYLSDGELVKPPLG